MVCGGSLVDRDASGERSSLLDLLALEDFACGPATIEMLNASRSRASNKLVAPHF